MHVNLPYSPGIGLFYFSLQNHAESHHRTNQAMTEGKVSCLSKQLESLMGFEPTTDRHQQITDSLTMVPNHHSLSLYSFIFTYINHTRIRSWNQPVLSN